MIICDHFPLSNNSCGAFDMALACLFVTCCDTVPLQDLNTTAATKTVCSQVWRQSCAYMAACFMHTTSLLPVPTLLITAPALALPAGLARASKPWRQLAASACVCLTSPLLLYLTWPGGVWRIATDCIVAVDRASSNSCHPAWHHDTEWSSSATRSGAQLAWADGCAE